MSIRPKAQRVLATLTGAAAVAALVAVPLAATAKAATTPTLTTAYEAKIGSQIYAHVEGSGFAPGGKVYVEIRDNKLWAPVGPPEDAEFVQYAAADGTLSANVPTPWSTNGERLAANAWDVTTQQYVNGPAAIYVQEPKTGIVFNSDWAGTLTSFGPVNNYASTLTVGGYSFTPNGPLTVEIRQCDGCSTAIQKLQTTASASGSLLLDTGRKLNNCWRWPNGTLGLAAVVWDNMKASYSNFVASGGDFIC